MTSIFIDGTIYDITDFAKIHPGGSVIHYYANSDATAAFNEFHFRSTYAKVILKSLPKLKNIPIHYPENKELLNDFYLLKQKLTALGFFKPSLLHITMRIAEIIFIFFTASFLF